MLHTLGHVLEIVILILLVKILHSCCKQSQSFVAGDPFGNSLKYVQFNDGVGTGPGANSYLLPDYLNGQDLVQ